MPHVAASCSRVSVVAAPTPGWRTIRPPVPLWRTRSAHSVAPVLQPPPRGRSVLQSEYGTAGPFRILRGLSTMGRTEPHTEGAGRVDTCSPRCACSGNGRAQEHHLGGTARAGLGQPVAGSGEHAHPARRGRLGLQVQTPRRRHDEEASGRPRPRRHRAGLDRPAPPARQVPPPRCPQEQPQGRGHRDRTPSRSTSVPSWAPRAPKFWMCIRQVYVVDGGHSIGPVVLQPRAGRTATQVASKSINSPRGCECLRIAVTQESRQKLQHRNLHR